MRSERKLAVSNNDERKEARQPNQEREKKIIRKVKEKRYEK